jgi:hypothetical protein
MSRYAQPEVGFGSRAGDAGPTRAHAKSRNTPEPDLIFGWRRPPSTATAHINDEAHPEGGPRPEACAPFPRLNKP